MHPICHRVGIRASLREVYQATFTPEHLAGWWAATAAGDGALGGQVELTFPGYPNHVWEVAELAEDQLVRLKLIAGPEPWHDSQLQFEFEASDNQVFVTLTHTTGPDTPPAAWQYFCTKWPMFLVSLKQYLETGQGLPYPDDLKIQHD